MSNLIVNNLTVDYGGISAVKNVSLEVKAGEIVALIGANGAGKTSILRAISGLITHSGEIIFNGNRLKELPTHKIVQLGIAHVPEGRGIFGNLTVRENLTIAAATKQGKIDYEKVFALFPRLKERVKQLGGTLSGGEQQMLAVGRALMGNCQLLLLDEPSMGLSPILIEEIFSFIKQLNQTGTTILLVEQNATQALNIATRGYVLETGEIKLVGSGQELLNNPKVKAFYLGA